MASAVGDSPEALHALNPNLDICGAYAAVHVLMPDGSMKLGGEAVAEVLRRLPSAWVKAVRWVAGVPNAIFGGVPDKGAATHLTARHATRTIPSPTLTANAMP